MSIYTPTVLPTIYDGIQFRSRTEARWALFFNSLNLVYEYERDGYDLGDGVRYLPDFWIPELRFWVEIKGDSVVEWIPREQNEEADALSRKAYVEAMGKTFPERIRR